MNYVENKLNNKQQFKVAYVQYDATLAIPIMRNKMINDNDKTD